MVGIYGIGMTPEPANPRRVNGYTKQADTQDTAARDVVLISQEAQSAAEDAATISKFVGLSEKQAEIREERVAQVRESLEKGTYKVQQVVLQVAARITKYLGD